MTLGDTPALKAELDKNVLLFGGKGAVTADLVAAWMEALPDVPFVQVQVAMEEHRKHGRFLPRPSTIRELVDRAAATRPRPVGFVPDDPAAPPHCGRCEDTGWETGLRCHGGQCGRKNCLATAPEGHTFTRRCSCRATNPVYQASLRHTYHRPEAA